MERWTEGQWMEWLDSRRDAEYTSEDAPSPEVHESWKEDVTWIRVGMATWFMHGLVEWRKDSGRLRNDLMEVLRARTPWRPERLKKVKVSGPWQEAVKEVFTNLIAT